MVWFLSRFEVRFLFSLWGFGFILKPTVKSLKGLFWEIACYCFRENGLSLILDVGFKDAIVKYNKTEEQTSVFVHFCAKE